MTMGTQIDTAAIALLGGLLADPAGLKKRLSEFATLQATVLQAEGDLEAHSAAFAELERKVRANLAERKAQLAKRCDMVAGREGCNEDNRQRLDRQETEWAGIGMPSEAPLNRYVEADDVSN